MITSLACLFAVAGPCTPTLMVHMMPWFAGKPVSGAWGWHWTMNHFDPDHGQIASHYHPLIGPYDSGDPDAIACQILLMKFAGIDGMFMDWYGDVEQYDYAIVHRNTRRMFEAASRAGLKFSLVYEDQTLNALVANKKFPVDRAVAEGKALMGRAQEAWFRSPSYLKLDGKPVLLVFGPQYYKDADWPEILGGLSPKPAFFTLHHRRGPAIGAFDWPLPKGGAEGCARERDGFYERAKGWATYIPAAYPRFHDFYKEAGIHDSWGYVEDADGKTFQTTLARALSSGAPIVQIATWNDWGEGTQIEPSTEFGYRDLVTLQRLRHSRFAAEDLRLPVRLYLLQKKRRDPRLNRVSTLLFAGRTMEAKKILDSLGRS